MVSRVVEGGKVGREEGQEGRKNEMDREKDCQTGKNAALRV